MIAQKDLIPVDNGGDPTKETFVLNLGPQHPAAHGVLRVLLTMDGEWIQRAEPVIGYIHRMHEKMGENRTWAKFLPNTSRIDYLSAMHYTHAFVGAVERAAREMLDQGSFGFARQAMDFDRLEALFTTKGERA